MTADLQFLQSDDRLRRLHELEVLLHLFQHRNKNQHRRSIWWRQFSTFRRQLKLLIHDIDSLVPATDTHVKRARIDAVRPRIKARLSQRIEFWQDICAAKWFQAFSQLTADGRFAALGLTLIGVLAEVCAIVGVTTLLEQQAETEIRHVLDHFGREAWSKEANISPDDDKEVSTGIDAEDAGTSIARETLSEKDALNREDEKEDDCVEPQRSASKIYQRKKRVKKGGNAIDDLFDDL